MFCYFGFIFPLFLPFSAENDEEMERIANQLTEFFEKSAIVVSNCAQIPLSEREERVAKLQRQLLEQDKSIKFLEANYSDKERVSSLFIFSDFFQLKRIPKNEMETFVICWKEAEFISTEELE